MKEPTHDPHLRFCTSALLPVNSCSAMAVQSQGSAILHSGL